MTIVTPQKASDSAKAEVQAANANPANDLQVDAQERIHRVPMSEATRTLEVDPLPGFHLHWFKASRVQRAKAAGYLLCSPDEVTINSHSIGASPELGGNTDLGDCVSVVGDKDTNERLVLMKLKEAWWQDDRAKLDQRNARIMGSIFGGESVGMNEQGQATGMPEGAYVREDRTSIQQGQGQPQARKPIMNRGMPRARTGGRFYI